MRALGSAHKPRQALLLVGLCLAMLSAACGGGSQSTPTASTAPTASPVASGVTSRPSATQNEIDLANTSPLLVAYGAGSSDFPSDQPGLAVGDFNGDGKDDVAAGARFADPNSSEDAGAAYVIFGSSNPPSSLDLASGDQDVTIDGPEASAGLGFNAAAGDLNGDGHADLIVSAPFALNAGGAPSGSVFIFFGPLKKGVIDLSHDSADVTIYGSTANGFFGDSVATGDVNGDGTADLIVGSTYAVMPGATGVGGGGVFVFFGRGSWPTQLTGDDAGTALYAPDSSDELGDFVTSGDVNGDGIADVIGTAEASDGPNNDRAVAAEVHILYGRHNFDKVYAPGEEDVIVYGAHTNDTLGFSLAAGDLNGDGIDDLAMSAHLVDSGVARTGAVYVMYGRHDLPKTLDMLSPPDYVARIEGASTADLLATSMAIADVNGDGKKELVLGGSFVDINGRADAGVIYILNAANLSGTVSVAGPELIESFVGSAPGDHLGSNVATGDFRGAHETDIFAIAETAAGPSPDRPQAGRVYVLKP